MPGVIISNVFTKVRMLSDNCKNNNNTRNVMVLNKYAIKNIFLIFIYFELHHYINFILKEAST